jgi:hypothetical protein
MYDQASIWSPQLSPFIFAALQEDSLLAEWKNNLKGLNRKLVSALSLPFAWFFDRYLTFVFFSNLGDSYIPIRLVLETKRTILYTIIPRSLLLEGTNPQLPETDCHYQLGYTQISQGTQGKFTSGGNSQ